MKPETCGFDISKINTEVEKLSEEKIQEILDDWCCGWKYFEDWQVGREHKTYVMTTDGVHQIENCPVYSCEEMNRWFSTFKRVEPLCIKAGDGRRSITANLVRRLRDGMTIEEVKKILVDELTKPVRIKFTDTREYSAKKTKFEFDGGKKWFTWIRCELPLLKRLSNKKFVEEHLNELMEYVYEDLRNDKKFKSYGVPVNILEPTNAVLTKAGTFVVMLQPKMLDEEERLMAKE